jgi:hypothetical protein
LWGANVELDRYSICGETKGRVIFLIGIVLWIGFGFLMLGYFFLDGIDGSVSLTPQLLSLDGNSDLRNLEMNLDGGHPLLNLVLHSTL